MPIRSSSLTTASYYQESDDWWQNSDGGWWHDGFYQENDSYDWWEDDSWYYQEQNMATEPEDPETSEKLKEAQKAERVAESLAIEASRTWADAQRATQALRKDRGFGLHSSPGGGPSGKCFICGGNHFARECPDRQHPGKSYSKGKGKFKGYMTEYEDLNYSSKGKFKGKGKGMNNHWLENFGTWKGNKGRGKPMHKSKDAPRSVNAYASDMLLAGLEVLEAQSSSASSSTDPGTGMIDCGATASAAPEAVVKSLIDTVLTHDKGAIIELDQSARPYFRFGNGRWGRALCRVHISSAVSGRTRQFSLYTLPNPAEYVSNNFDRSCLVPVLIGMDHLGHKGVGMMIDFSLGLAMNTLDENPEIYHLDKNHKGHFMLDIVQYLTQGQRSHDGQPHVIVRSSSSSSPQQEEHQFLELGTVYMDMTLQDHELDAQMLQAARDRMTHMFQYAQHRRSPAALTAQMPVDACVNNSVSTTSSSCPSGHVALPDADSRGQHRERDQEANASCKGEGQAPRLCSEDSHRQTGSSLQRESVALSQPPHGQQGDEQHARKLGPLRMLQRSSGVCTPDRKCSSSHQGGVSGNGEPNAGGIGATNGTAPSHSENLLGHDGEDQCGGEASHSDLRAEDGDYINRPWIHERRGSPQQPGRLHQRVLDQHGDRGSGNGLRTRGQPTVTPLPLSVGKKIMSMATMLMAFTSSLLLSLHLGPRDGLWEVACAPHSWLSMAADEHGLQPRRIGYDLYQASTWDRLREERRQRRPRRIWFSLPCTKWCAWTSINYSSPDRQVVLETARRRERKLLWYVNVFIKETLDEDDSVEIYFEWPWPCFGWKQQPLLDLAAYMDKKMIPWLDCRIDGCNYGMRDPHGQFIQKKWLVKTTSEKFHKVFRAKVCQGGHGVHANIQGQLTSASAYYPWRLVQAIARHWRDATVPHRHIHLLHQRDEPLHEQQSSWSMVMDEFEVVTDIQELAVSEENEITIASAEVIQLEYTARTYRMSRQITSQMCEEILMSMYYGVNLKKDDHSKWKTSSFHLVFGGYSHGGFCGCTLATTRYPETVQLLNAYLQRLLPQHTWTSIMVTFNGKSVPHKDHHNLPGTLNATICLGSFTGGEMWLAGSPPAGTVPTRRRRTDGTMVDGYLVNTYGQPVIFSPSILHATQDWKGFRIAITAYTTRMYPAFDVDDNRRLHKLGFPLPRRQSQELHAAHTSSTTTSGELGNVYEVQSRELAAHTSSTTTSGGASVDMITTSSSPGCLQAATSSNNPVEEEDVSDQLRDQWEAQLAKFHKAAGHPTSRKLARVVKEAGHPEWKVQAALNYKCPTCESLKPGGVSSGQVPPASTTPFYQAWEAISADAGEWVVPGSKMKVKFILFMDLATKLRVVYPVKIYEVLAMQAESAEDVIMGLSERWLSSFPKPKLLVMDAAKTFSSERMHAFLSSVNIIPHFVAEKEPWAHGVTEANVQDVKHTASAIHKEALDQHPFISLYLAVSALNSTEVTAGYSAYQWAYGQQFQITDEDARTFAVIPKDPSYDYARLLAAREEAEIIAKKTKARRVLSKLANTTVRQPLREFEPMTLVKVWRKLWPVDVHKGPRGGLKKSGRPHWVGPGRVVFHEVLPQQAPGDHRRHVVWVLIGTQVFRCSVHSVRPVTETERFMYETSGQEDFSKWKTLADVLPRREYTDITEEEPNEDEVEMPNLPPQPDATTTVNPSRRVTGKATPMDEPSSSTSAPAMTRPLEDVNDYDNEPATKKARGDDLDWVEQLTLEAEQESKCMDIFAAMDDTEEFLKIEFDVGDLSNRQRKHLERDPVSFMVKKMRDSEVTISRLKPEERPLFGRAKAKEVDSFMRNEAVRKCLHQDEVREAYSSGRIVKARWVLTWKPVPPEDREAALRDQQTNPETLHTKDGSRKAKARIVLLGFQHPSLLDPSFKTSSPVQSTLGRNLLYAMSVQHQWPLEGLDLATAFLQTLPTEADKNLWTTGVEELRDALGVGQEGIMRILRNIYGSTTAPRGLWLDLHRKLTSLGAQAVRGERCLWVWLSRTRKDRDHPLSIGAMGGHVDDFHRLGDGSSEWLEIKQKIDSVYQWGTAKTGSYRHAGTDVTTSVDERGYQQITVDQNCYVESLQDVQISPDRLSVDLPLTKQEMEACRTSLGALQWLAVQSQPQLCSRCNLLLTDLITEGKTSVAKEIQQMIGEVRAEPFVLKFTKLDGVQHWTDLIVISMGDQAHGNRPQGGSTGGMVTLLSGPSSLSGQVCVMTLISWRTWKLKRRAIGSNDAEVQSILEAEDANFRTRLLWSELHGAGGLEAERSRRLDLVEDTEKQVLRVQGVLCTDSKGGFDAVEVNESPLLGLSNMRAALQAFQLRENLQRAGCLLRWLASDYDLADALTKKKADSRTGLVQFLRTGYWSIKYDPSFTSAKRNKQRGHTAIDVISRQLQSPPEYVADLCLGLVQHSFSDG